MNELSAGATVQTGPQVLVIDDDPDLCALIVEVLEMEGLRCTAVHDGRTAVDMALRLRPDLIILDLLMPEITGDEVLRRLQADHRTRYTPVVLVTANSAIGDKVRHLRAGADDYITKPFDLDELTARVLTALRRARTLGGLNPLSGLPGNTAIFDEIARRLDRQEPFACLYIDLDHFKSFNDRYGFTRGDELIGALAGAIFDTVATLRCEDCFLGHVGGDDFVVLSGIPAAPALADGIVAGFAERSRDLHDEGDRVAGGYEALDRRGRHVRWSLATVSIGIALAEAGRFASPAALAQVAAELKVVAKRRPGSVLLERRGASTPAH
ncbi:MAG TPA: response regulator [Candidatus Saccharimonadales bacterium]|nr:response regulator [Candidatus Saccharimonadales bacterium]